MTTIQQRKAIAPIAELLLKSLEAACNGDLTSLSVAEYAVAIHCATMLREYSRFDMQTRQPSVDVPR